MDREAAQSLLEEMLVDRKIFLGCKRHMFVAGGAARPTIGCVNCHKAMLTFMIASTPKKNREKVRELLSKIIVDLSGKIDRGEDLGDFNFPARPLIKISKEN